MNYWNSPDIEFKSLVGCTLSAITGLAAGSEEVRFITTDGREFVMYHARNCCELVNIESVVGDVADLIGHPILVAEESSNSEENPPDYTVPDYQDSFTWTFYKLATAIRARSQP